jgi:glutamyl-tRNA synthetase
LPEAVLNYLVRLGWSHGDQEIFTVEEMIRLFDISDVNKSASAFDAEKLAWLNQQHMMRVPASRIVPVLRWHLEREGVQASNEAQLEQIVLAQRERAKTVRQMAVNSAFFFRAPTIFDEKAVRKHVNTEVLAMLVQVSDQLDRLPDWSAAAIHEVINGVAVANGASLGKLAQPIRLAVSGGTVSPPIDATLAILGKTESLTRLAHARASWAADHSFS